jgi:hypothetical protein
LPAAQADLNNPPNPLYQGGKISGADSLTRIYNDYVAAHDKDSDGVLDLADNCPDLANPDQLDTNSNGIGDVCDSTDAPQSVSTSTPEQSGAAADAETASSIMPGADAPQRVSAPAIPEPTTVDIIHRNPRPNPNPRPRNSMNY